MKPYWIFLLCLLNFACAKPKCTASLATYKIQVNQALGDKTIDKQVYDDQQRRIGEIEKTCAAGDDQAALSSLFDAAIALNLGADDTYARSLNNGSAPSEQRATSQK
ncbi:hypothetical protein [Burkholderia territorii]|uniref:hypothetical protein n=1 Tax=Burkholderia territorii TaxID=1503055 RepID=UPI0007B8E6C9|nr:hypothetical protein [Burkholderia territorii]